MHDEEPAAPAPAPTAATHQAPPPTGYDASPPEGFDDPGPAGYGAPASAAPAAPAQAAPASAQPAPSLRRGGDVALDEHAIVAHLVTELGAEELTGQPGPDRDPA